MPAVADDASGAVRPDFSRLATGPVRRHCRNQAGTRAIGCSTEGAAVPMRQVAIASSSAAAQPKVSAPHPGQDRVPAIDRRRYVAAAQPDDSDLASGQTVLPVAKILMIYFWRDARWTPFCQRLSIA